MKVILSVEIPVIVYRKPFCLKLWNIWNFCFLSTEQEQQISSKTENFSLNIKHKFFCTCSITTKGKFLYISVGSFIGCVCFCVRFCVSFVVIFCTFLSTKYEYLGIRLDLTEINMILREKVWFNENWYDFTRKCIIFWENWYDITRKGLI